MMFRAESSDARHSDDGAVEGIPCQAIVWFELHEVLRLVQDDKL